MQTRRAWMLSLTSGLVALAVLVGPAIAAELLGTVKSVDVEGKKIVVTEKESDKDVDLKVTDDTVLETARGKILKTDLEKMKKGMEVVVTHKGGVASKIVIKKGVAKKQKN